MISYDPSYIISKDPLRFGGEQSDYVKESHKIIQYITKKIVIARDRGDDIKKLFFEIIDYLSDSRRELAKKHNTHKCEDFGKRREELFQT